MGSTSRSLPVHDSLDVVEATDLYRTGEWWKSVVTYRFEDGDADETAVYLWHEDDDDWTRKNKYVVKTPEAWANDREVIDRFIRSEPPTTETTEFPVSDYYTVGAGETVFRSDGWWKAIVNVVEKGDYETNEVMVYLWQERDGEWRRRQKYTIKRVSDWEEEREAVEDHLSMDTADDSRRKDAPEASSTSESRATGEVEEFSTLSDELDTHLSEEFTSDSDS